MEIVRGPRGGGVVVTADLMRWSASVVLKGCAASCP